MINLQNTKHQLLLTPTTAASSSRSASFDWSGADHATIHIFQSPSVGTNSGAIQSVSLLAADSVPTQATQFTTIVADLGTQVTSSHEIVYHVDLKTKARYGKIIITPHSVDTVITSAHLITSRLESTPTNTTAMVNTTNDSVTIVT